MKIKRKKHLTFGDLVAAAYRAWGKTRAQEMMRLAVNTGLVVFDGGAPVLVSEGRTRRHE